MYGLNGKFTAQPGQREALSGHLLQAARLLEDFEGCYLYVVSHDAHDPDGIWVSEVWRSQADHQASLTHAAVAALIAEARPLIAAVGERVELIPLGGKGLPDGGGHAARHGG